MPNGYWSSISRLCRCSPRFAGRWLIRMYLAGPTIQWDSIHLPRYRWWMLRAGWRAATGRAATGAESRQCVLRPLACEAVQARHNAARISQAAAPPVDGGRLAAQVIMTQQIGRAHV